MTGCWGASPPSRPFRSTRCSWWSGGGCSRPRLCRGLGRALDPRALGGARSRGARSGGRHERRAHMTVGAEEAEQRLDRWFRKQFPHVPQGRIEKMCRKGEIRVDGARAKSATRIAPGQVVRVPPLPDEAPPPPEPRETGPSEAEAREIRAAVVFRDDHMIVLNKPAGPRGAGRHGPAPASGRAAAGAALRARGRPAPRPPARQGHLGPAGARAHRRGGGGAGAAVPLAQRSRRPISRWSPGGRSRGRAPCARRWPRAATGGGRRCRSSTPTPPARSTAPATRRPITR